MTCGCCQTYYDQDNDLAVFGFLKDCNGTTWALCGPCIQAIWQERAPHADPIAPLMA